jgi:uncharacterized membrane protein YoaK (UPF0700 family)
VQSNIRQTDTWLSFGLAFVGGYGDAASFILAKTFTGHVTGNVVLGAIAVAARDWRATLGSLSAIVAFSTGVLLSTLLVRPLKAWPSWPLLPTIMGIEVILMVAASLALVSGVTPRVEMFVTFVSLALGLQNGAVRHVGGISVHTTYVTGMITDLISAEAGKYVSEVVPPPARTADPKTDLLCGIWIAFVLGAGIGATIVFHLKGLGILGAALLLTTLILHNSKRSQMTDTS